jgi:hypothetical protein
MLWQRWLPLVRKQQNTQICFIHCYTYNLISATDIAAKLPLHTFHVPGPILLQMGDRLHCCHPPMVRRLYSLSNGPTVLSSAAALPVTPSVLM